jgi:FKBP-type peptidyl-prolyl cis-trans isomerase SlyD
MIPFHRSSEAMGLEDKQLPIRFTSSLLPEGSLRFDRGLTMEIGKDMFVILEYTVRLKDGSYVKGEGTPVSLNFISGYDQILPSLEKRLVGLELGAETDFIIPAREAFGEHDKNQVRRKSFKEFPEGRSLEVGKWVVATNSETQAQYGYYVKEKTDDEVVLDYNHPLAGKDLYYHVKVVHLRPASKEELKEIRPCEHADEEEESRAVSLQ